MTDKFFFLFISLIILPDLFIYKMIIIQITQKRIKYLYYLPSVLILIALLLLKFLSPVVLVEYPTVVGWVVFSILAFVVPKLLFFVCSILDICIKFFLRWPISGFDILSLALPIVSLGVLFYGAFIGKTNFKVNEVTISSASIPASFDGYRIVQLSDFHIGSFNSNPKMVKKIIGMTNDQKADLVVFTGDLINSRAQEVEPFKEILMSLRGKDGIYSVLGNHDYCHYYPWEGEWQAKANLETLKERQAWMGWRLLNNEHVYLYRQNDSIALIGVENWGKPPFEGTGDLRKAISGIDEDAFKILLTHNPTHWDEEVLPITDIQLTLAGHTHATQFKLGSFSPAQWRYKEWGGLYTQGKQSMYVNVGVGYIGLPFRFGAWPEITVFTLKRAETAN